MNNFKSFVPAALQIKILALVHSSMELVNNTGECVIGCEEPEPIEGNYVSGWNPHQDGGFRASSYISNDDGYHVCESYKAENDRMYFECLADFCRENDIKFTRDSNVLSNKIEIDDESFWDSDENREQFYSYQDEWNSDGNESLLSFECFVDMESEASYHRIGNREMQDLVTIRLSVNFKDAPYYREKYATDLYQAVYSVDEFMSMDNDDILAAVKIDKNK